MIDIADDLLEERDPDEVTPEQVRRVASVPEKPPAKPEPKP